jgi:molybdate transport system substrate-binding protein
LASGAQFRRVLNDAEDEMLFARQMMAALAIGLLSLPAQAVLAAELRLIAATPMTGVVKEVGAQFERTSGGHTLAMKFVSGPIVKREIDAGASYDVAVSITPVIDALIKEGKLAAETRADVGYAVVAVGVRTGAPKPDISTVEAFKQALLNAKSVAHSATGASGDHFKGILQKLGIVDRMQGKLRPMPADTIAQAVPSGQAEMIVVTASVIVVPGAELVGPIPAELQFYNTFAAALGSQSRNRDAGQEFVRLLTQPATRPVFKAHGMEPGLPKQQ